MVVDCAAEVSPGDELALSCEVADGARVSARARVISFAAGQVTASVSPRADMLEVLARHALERRSGKVAEAGSRRAHERYATFLQASFRNLQQLTTEYVTNVSLGGLFVRTPRPPELHSFVTVGITFPGGELHEVSGEVVRVVTAEEAAARGTTAGCGLRLNPDDAYAAAFEQLIHQYLTRRRRVLVVDDDRFFLRVLADGLMARGIEVAIAPSGMDAAHLLVDIFYELDGVVVDLNMAGLNGIALIDRIRRFGRETDVRVAVVSSAPEHVLESLVGPGKADLALPKSLGVDQICQRIRELLG